MSKKLTLDDLDEKVRQRVYGQDYKEKPVIEGVKIVELHPYVSEEGDFGEVFRVRDNGEVEGFAGFKIAQVNRTMLLPHAVKAWHLHLGHDEIWFLLPQQNLFAGLWDVRKDSKTNGTTMRIPLGGNRRMVFIPRGVAHGGANFTEKPVEIFYFVNERFNRENPDEKRINWDALGADFWKPQRD